MINFFSKFKIFFYVINLLLIILYLFPGSLLGCIFFDNCKVQPQITSDVLYYLLVISVLLEVFHILIPERSFQWSDLFGNLLGVIVVIFVKSLINKYGITKK